MKVVIFTSLLLAASISCCAQEVASQNPPDLNVIKFDWVKERISWTRDPLSVPNETYNDMRERVRTERRPRSAIEEKNVRDARREKHRPDKPPRYAFRYELTVRNTGSKEIKEVDWDYLFSDAVTGELLGKHEFTSVESIGPGDKKKLAVLASAPPTHTISVHSLGPDERSGLLTKVEIIRILFEDESTWIRPVTSSP